jgi:hypothetical protein
MQIFSVQSSRRRTFSPGRRAILVAAVLVVALSGCSRGTQGIFATIEIEEKTNTSNLVDNTTINALVRTEDRLVVLAGTKVFSRLTDGSDWGEIGSPGGLTGTQLAGVNADGSSDGIVDEVYGVFFDSGNDRFYMYRLDTASLSWTAVDTAKWDPGTGDEITGMLDVHDRMLLSVTRNTDGNRELLSFGAGLSGPVVLGDFRGSLTDAAWNGSAGVVVSRNNLMGHVSDLGTAGALTVPALGSGVTNVTGVGAFPDYFVDPEGSATSFAVTTLNGTIWVSTSGVAGSWVKADGELSTRSFSDIEWVENVEVLVTGTRPDPDLNTSSRGYFESIAPRDSDYTLSLTNEIASSYTGSELSTAAITRFRYYPDINTLFALTNGLGLWSGVYSSPRNPSWTWE